MSLAIDLLTRLGFGGAAVTALSLGLVAFYLLKARAIGATASAAASAGVAYAVAVLTVAAGVLLLGWADPNPSVAMEHIGRAVEVGVDRAAEPGRRLARWLVETLTS